MDRLPKQSEDFPVVVGLLGCLALAGALFLIPFRGFTGGWVYTEFVQSLVAPMPILVCLAYFTINNHKEKKRTEQIQATVLGKNWEAYEKLPFGIIASNLNQVGITYRPMTEVILNWEEIASVTLCRLGDVLDHTAFDPSVQTPKFRSWQKPVILLQTSRKDFPILPVVFETMQSAKRWNSLLSSKQTASKPFCIANLSRKERIQWLLLQWGIVWILVAIALYASARLPGVKWDSQLANGWAMIGNFGIAGLGFLATWREDGELAIPQSINPARDVNRIDAIAPLAPFVGALWITEPNNLLERIPLDSIESVELVSKKSPWSDDIFKRPQYNHADLILHLNRDHDRARKFSMTKLGAEHSIAALLAERPELKILGSIDLLHQPSK